MSSPQPNEKPSAVQPVHKTPRRPLQWILNRFLAVGLFLAAGVILVILIGIAQRTGWIRAHDGAAQPTAAADPGAIYTCPMHPQIRQSTPGRCPICGMELVPASSASADLDEFSVKIEPAQRRLANIQTAQVESAPLEATIQTVGVIAIDESRQATIAAYVEGRLERLFADYTGIDIKKGDHLAVIYSPQLYSAQVEYVEARRALSSVEGLPAVRQAQEALVANTRQRLREFGMTDEQIGEVDHSTKAESRLTIYAPQGGTVVEKLAIEGNYVKSGDPVYRIADLSTVWLMLKLFPEDAARIRFGQRVQAELQSLPGESLLGRVAFIDPVVDIKTRTVGVRVELMNERRRLKPGDYATAQVKFPIGAKGEIYDADLAGKWISPMHPQIIRDEPGQCPICGMNLVPTAQFGFMGDPIPQPKSLYVPRSAVLLAGGNSVVYIESKPGVFEIRAVTVGSILRDRIVILNGLKEGESVATAGNFLIDSQMQLAGKPSLIDPMRAVAKSQEQKGPLQLDNVTITPIEGQDGENLEALFASYFEIQRALAADQKPPAGASEALHTRAIELKTETTLPTELKAYLAEIASLSEHLHHLDLAGARKAFKPISHAILKLAAQVRRAGAEAAFTHFYCPMVPGGGGDWLQAEGELLNPYFGSEMLHCGEKVQIFPTSIKPTDEKHDRKEKDTAAPGKQGE